MSISACKNVEMKMMIDATIIADSVSVLGNRLTTFEIEFPRFILPQFLTHRAFSRNGASSRAISVEKRIAALREDGGTALPSKYFKARQGMSGKEEIPVSISNMVRDEILQLRNTVIEAVEKMNSSYSVHQSTLNRYLEPFMWQRMLVTGDEAGFRNFFILRCEDDAQIEMQELAKLMALKYVKSKPDLSVLHIPYIDKDLKNGLLDIREELIQQDKVPEEFKPRYRFFMALSSAMCARVSYLGNKLLSIEEVEKQLKFATRLLRPPGDEKRMHASPFEHAARSCEEEGSRNFKEWLQFREILENV